MKKLLSAIAAMFIARNLFAISFTGGLVYTFSDVKTLDTSTFPYTLTNESDMTNYIGGQAGLYNTLFGPVGFFTDVQFLFPMSSVKTNADGSFKAFEPTSDFTINAIFGPAFSIASSDHFRIKIGAGIDLGFNTEDYKDSENAFFRTYTFKYGLGAKVDADIMLFGPIGINVGCDFGAVWGTENFTIDKTNVSESHKNDYDNSGAKKTFNFLILPSASVVIKLGS